MDSPTLVFVREIATPSSPNFVMKPTFDDFFGVTTRTASASVLVYVPADIIVFFHET